MKCFTYTCLLACSVAAPVFAGDGEAVKFKGAQVFYEFGNIVKGVELALDTLDNMWTQRFGGTFDIQAKRGDHLNIYFGAGSIFWHAIPEIPTATPSQVFNGDAILTKAYADFAFGGLDRPALQVKLGFFPVKYSSSRNLGEYLFRTGSYPSFIVTGNGFTAVNVNSMAVLGTQWTHNLSESLSHDLFLTSERNSYPLHDFSLSYLAKYHGGLFSAGLGLQLDRLIPVRPSNTTPNKEANKYFTYQDQEYTTNSDFYRARALRATKKGNAVEAAQWSAIQTLVDSLKVHWETNPGEEPAMGTYTFKGIKPLVMASLDFKSLFGGDFFRGDEMVLYAEAVLMGIENQPIFYDNRMDRVALMVGFNIPTFGLLDDMNFEIERHTAKYINGYLNAREGKIPQPDFFYNALEGYDPEDWKRDDIKWSLFLNKEIMKGFNVQVQAASDHLRGRRHTRVVSENSILIDKSNPLSGGAHWYYFIKLQASI